MASIALKLLFLLGLFVCDTWAQYTPDWDSLDKRPLPAWYDESKLGIFIHWGVFSVPSFSSEWFWWDWQGAKLPGVQQFMQENYRPDFTYADFAPMFTAEFYNSDEWANIFNSSGARYIVFVSKHHEGYTNWPSKYSFNWNSMDVGPKRDIVGELAQSIRSKTSLHFGLYHSMFEWFHPLYLNDKSNNFSTQDFVNDKTLPELYEIVNTYKPDVVWSDGDWEAMDDYWKSKDFLAWLYNDSPVKDTVVVNDRWGRNVGCAHGGFYTCGDRFNPGHLVNHKWENAMTIDKYSWGYRRNARLVDYLTMEQLIDTFVKTVSCGGNMLMNVGPRHDGTIDPIYQERLKAMGDWMAVNGDGIYGTTPWKYQNDTINSDVWYTMKQGDSGTLVYAILLNWPTGDTVHLGAPMTTVSTVVSMLGLPGKLSFSSTGTAGMIINLNPINPNINPSKYAWVFQLEGLAN
ncbi:hypothetical protein ACJMK2_016652 [Sinanodonta woodiana]|uniref:alpha-L-fucosidase n=1 Tax=Sinanodonta woodiana TaxID=1069815 RepID=A0ABD3UXV0_SINWO